jgi:hypothetical protein
MTEEIKGSSMDPEGVVTKRRRDPIVNRPKVPSGVSEKKERDLEKTVIDPDPKAAKRVPGQEDYLPGRADQKGILLPDVDDEEFI